MFLLVAKSIRGLRTGTLHYPRCTPPVNAKLKDTGFDRKQIAPDLSPRPIRDPRLAVDSSFRCDIVGAGRDSGHRAMTKNNRHVVDRQAVEGKISSPLRSPSGSAAWMRVWRNWKTRRFPKPLTSQRFLRVRVPPSALTEGYRLIHETSNPKGETHVHDDTWPRPRSHVHRLGVGR